MALSDLPNTISESFFRGFKEISSKIINIVISQR